MTRPVIGVIGNAYVVESRYMTQLVGTNNLRAVAEVANALPLMFAGSPRVTDIADVLAAVDGVLADGRSGQCPSVAFQYRAACKARAL